jgi:hypothetical protein
LPNSQLAVAAALAGELLLVRNDQEAALALALREMNRIFR